MGIGDNEHDDEAGCGMIKGQKREKMGVSCLCRI